MKVGGRRASNVIVNCNAILIQSFIEKQVGSRAFMGCGRWEANTDLLTRAFVCEGVSSVSVGHTLLCGHLIYTCESVCPGGRRV